MGLKRYLGKIKHKIEKPRQEHETTQEIKPNVIEEIEPEIIEEVDVNVKKTMDFVDTKKDPHEYLKRYLKEPKYKDWFNRNYPNFTIYEAVGLTASDYIEMKRRLFPESEHITNETRSTEQIKSSNEPNFKPTYEHDSKTTFGEFIDERILVSHNAIGDKEMKIKIIEISDENPPLVSKFGNRVK
ncbi:uncharacterized protein METZ01_LOCUS292241, partial [marine metagenome]